MKPRYEHDCDNCKFAGRYMQYDIWVHPPPDSFEAGLSGTFILRYGFDGPEYLSYPFEIIAQKLSTETMAAW